MTNEEELPKGYKCSRCKRFNKYPPYVYAHWDIALTHTCECGAKYSVRDGNAVIVIELDTSKNDALTSVP